MMTLRENDLLLFNTRMKTALFSIKLATFFSSEDIIMNLKCFFFFQSYRISHSHPTHYIATAASQLPSQSQPPPRIPNSSPQYLVTSPPAPAHVRFQSPYQAAPSQTAGFYHH